MGSMSICFPTGGIEVTNAMIDEKLGVSKGLCRLDEESNLFARFTADPNNANVIRMSLTEPKGGLSLYTKGIDMVIGKLKDAGLIKTASMWYLDKDDNDMNVECRLIFDLKEEVKDKSNLYDELCIEFSDAGYVERDLNGEVIDFAIRSEFGCVTCKPKQLYITLNDRRYESDVDWSLLTAEGLGKLLERLNWLVGGQKGRVLRISVAKLGCGCGCCGERCSCI